MKNTRWNLNYHLHMWIKQDCEDPSGCCKGQMGRSSERDLHSAHSPSLACTAGALTHVEENRGRWLVSPLLFNQLRQAKRSIRGVSRGRGRLALDPLLSADLAFIPAG